MNNHKASVGIDIPIEMCDYNDAQLLDVIGHLLKSLRTLANTLDESRPDVANVLDSIIDHPDKDVEPEVKQLSDSAQYGIDKILTIDRRQHRLLKINEDSGRIIYDVPLLDLFALKKKMHKMGLIE